MVPTCWSEAEAEDRDGAPRERIDLKKQKQKNGTRRLQKAEGKHSPLPWGALSGPPNACRVGRPLLRPVAPGQADAVPQHESGTRHQLFPCRPLGQVSPRAQPSRCFLDCCRLWAPGWETCWLSKLAILGGSCVWCGAMLAFKASHFGGLLCLGVLGVGLKPLAPQGLAFPPTGGHRGGVGLW